MAESDLHDFVKILFEHIGRRTEEVFEHLLVYLTTRHVHHGLCRQAVAVIVKIKVGGTGRRIVYLVDFAQQRRLAFLRQVERQATEIVQALVLFVITDVADTSALSVTTSK